MYLISFCNQDRPHRRFALAAFERPGDPLAWIRIGAGRRDFGATGMICHDGFVFVIVQSKQLPRLVALDTRHWTLVASSPLSQVRDPHSLALRDGHLFVASTGDNAVYELLLDGPRLASERLHWRYPETSDDEDDVHLNSLTFVGDELLVSAFGPRDPEGRWSSDGRVLNVDAAAVLAEGVNQPHSLLHSPGFLMFCESRTGRLHVACEPEKKIAFGAYGVAGYTRGLAHTGDGVLIGVSGSRATSRSTGKALDVSLDTTSCGLWKLAFTAGKTTCLIDLSGSGNEIYDLLAIDAPMPAFDRAPVRNALAETLRGLLYRG